MNKSFLQKLGLTSKVLFGCAAFGLISAVMVCLLVASSLENSGSAEPPNVVAIFILVGSALALAVIFLIMALKMRRFEQSNATPSNSVAIKDVAKSEKKFDSAWKIRAGLTILVLHGIGLVIAGLISAALNEDGSLSVFVYFYFGWIPLALLIMPFLKKHLK